MRLGFAVLLAVVIGWSGRVSAGDLEAPSGPVILTVAGAIESPNRGPFRPFDDAFFKNMDVTFERAAAFDRAMLTALGETEITASYESWPAGPMTFSGPLLRDVLAAAGAQGERIRVHALDGYSVEIPMAEVARWPVVLALSRDGRPLGIGGHGPSWVMYPRDSVPELEQRDDSQLVWAVVLIEVE